MFRHNFLTYSGKIITQILWEIFYFPLWWYSVGFVRLTKNVFHFWSDQQQALGFSVWAKNIFVPMYGQHDWSGRIISFVIRLIQIIVRGTILLFWLLIVVIILIIWLLLPLLLLLALVFQISK